MPARFYNWPSTELASGVSFQISNLVNFVQISIFDFVRKQKQMWDAGETYRKRNGLSAPVKHSMGIYSFSDINRIKTNDNVTGIMKKVDSMEINDPEEEFKSEENKITQGDKLNEIKAQRSKTKPLSSNLYVETGFVFMSF